MALKPANSVVTPSVSVTASITVLKAA